MSGPWGQSQRIHAGTSGGGARPALTGVSGLSQRIYTSTTGGPRPALSGVSGLSQRIRAPGGCVAWSIDLFTPRVACGGWGLADTDQPDTERYWQSGTPGGG